MKEIFLETESLIIQPLSESSYENVTKMYIDFESNCYATGVFNVIEYDKAEEIVKSGKEIETAFSLVARDKKNKDFIGYLKGCIHKDSPSAWINILMIAPEHRQKGYGREFANSVMCYLNTKLNIKAIYVGVVDDSIIAKKFWNTLNFKIDKILNKSLIEGNELSKINIFVKKY